MINIARQGQEENELISRVDTVSVLFVELLLSVINNVC